MYVERTLTVAKQTEITEEVTSCEAQTSDVTYIKNCYAARSSRAYFVDLTSPDGSKTTRTMVWCNKESLDSVGYIDLVKTFNIGGIDKDTLLFAYFFKSNDNGNLTVESVENSSGTLGLLIKILVMVQAMTTTLMAFIYTKKNKYLTLLK